MKTVNMIISAVVFTALALGLAGAGKPVIGVALVLQAVQFVFLYGRNWGSESGGSKIKGGFDPLPTVDKQQEKQQEDQIKTINEP